MLLRLSVPIGQPLTRMERCDSQNNGSPGDVHVLISGTCEYVVTLGWPKSSFGFFISWCWGTRPNFMANPIANQWMLKVAEVLKIPED